MSESIDRAFTAITLGIQDEIVAIKRRNQVSPLRATNFASKGRTETGGFLYKAEVDAGEEGIGIPEGVGIRVIWYIRDRIGTDQLVYQATLLSFDPWNSEVHFSSDSPIPFQYNGQLLIEPMVDELLKALKSRIQSAQRTSELYAILFDRQLQLNSISSTHSRIDQSLLDETQQEAIRSTICRKLSFLWGPPGTGKTQSLACLIKELLLRKERVLVLAQSNVAVDQLALKYCKGVKLKADEALRFGFARLAEVRRIESLFPARAIALELRLEIDRLESLLKKTLSGSDKAILQDKLIKLKGELRRASIDPISKARVIFTTVVQTCIEDKFLHQNFDSVIVDEASMLSAAYLVFLASIPSKRLIIAGDYCQLGPIAVSDTLNSNRWLRRDPFQIMELKGLVNHQALSMLQIQRRMHPDICQIISETFYHRMLRNDVRESEMASTVMAPEPERPIVFIPVPIGSATNVLKEKSSRYNAASGKVVRELMKKFLRVASDPSIGIITPYRMQVQVHKNSLKSIAGIRPTRLERCKIGTIHAFQGDESDVIILDLVDDRHSGPGRLYEGDSGERLINVAISRAKGKLIVVGDPLLFDSPLAKGRFPVLAKVFDIYLKPHLLGGR